MIYFYYGEDSFRAKETIQKLKKKFIELYDPSGHNIETIDHSNFSLERFFTSVKAMGFLSSKKFILTKNIFTVKNFSDIQDELIAYLKTQKNTKDENYLIFWHEGVPRQNLKLFKHLKKVCTQLTIKEFKKLDQNKLVAWTQQQAIAQNKKIEKNAAELLISLIGDSTWQLHQEVIKLCNFTLKDTITSKDVTELITASQGESIFALLDAIGSKNKPTALRLLEEYFIQESDRQYLVNMIIRQFRLIVHTKEASKTTSNSYALAQQLRLHPFVAKKMLQQSARYEHNELERIYQNLIALDGILKSDPKYIETALTLFVTKL